MDGRQRVGQLELALAEQEHVVDSLRCSIQGVA